MKPYLENNFDFENHDLISSIDDLCLWAAPFGIKLIETVNYKPNIKLLDIGFGTGFPLLELSQRLGPTCIATGLDPWEDGHKRTKMKIKQMGIKNVDLVIGEAENMPFPDNTFDLIVSNNGLNNVIDEVKSYNECYRVSKKGGQFVFTFNLPESFIEFYEMYEKYLFELGKSVEIQKLKEHIHHKRKSAREIEEMVSNVGFTITSIVIDSFTWKYTDGTAMLNHPFIRLAFIEPWYSILEENDKESIFTELEKRMNVIANKKGLFSLTIPYVTFNCTKK